MSYVVRKVISRTFRISCRCLSREDTERLAAIVQGSIGEVLVQDNDRYATCEQSDKIVTRAVEGVTVVRRLERSGGVDAVQRHDGGSIVAGKSLLGDSREGDAVRDDAGRVTGKSLRNQFLLCFAFHFFSFLEHNSQTQSKLLHDIEHVGQGDTFLSVQVVL